MLGEYATHSLKFNSFYPTCRAVTPVRLLQVKVGLELFSRALRNLLSVISSGLRVYIIIFNIDNVGGRVCCPDRGACGRPYSVPSFGSFKIALRFIRPPLPNTLRRMSLYVRHLSRIWSTVCRPSPQWHPGSSLLWRDHSLDRNQKQQLTDGSHLGAPLSIQALSSNLMSKQGDIPQVSELRFWLPTSTCGKEPVLQSHFCILRTSTHFCCHTTSMGMFKAVKKPS